MFKRQIPQYFFLVAFFHPSIFYHCPCGSGPSQLVRAKADHCTAAVMSGTFHLICLRRGREVHPSLFGAKLCSTFLTRHSSLPAAGSPGSLSACQHLELRSKPNATAAVCASGNFAPANLAKLGFADMADGYPQGSGII